MTTKARRDLAADLALCEAATPGPLYADEDEWPGNANLRHWIGNHDDGIGCFVRYEDAKFAAEAREGWPEALRRAIAAEEEVERLRSALETTQYHLYREQYMSATDTVDSALEVSEDAAQTSE